MDIDVIFPIMLIFIIIEPLTLHNNAPTPPLARHIETELSYAFVSINTICYRFHNYVSFIFVFVESF
jgi:hypothetical protein